MVAKVANRAWSAGRSRWAPYVLAGVLLALIVGAVGAAVYSTQVAPSSRPVVTVDGTEVPMRYFIKRVRLSGREPMEVLDEVIRDEIVRSVASRPPFEIEIGEDDVDKFLRNVAAEETGNDGDDAFETWRRSQLNETDMNEAEFNNTVRIRLMRQRLGALLAEEAGGDVEQVRLNMLPLSTLAEARDAKGRLDAGAAFPEVVASLSDNPALVRRGGDMGWVPRDALSPSIAEAAFDNLPIGTVSEPLPRLDRRGFLIVMPAAREVRPADDGRVRSLVAARALDDWLNARFDEREIEIHGLDGGYDAATDRWIREQVLQYGQ